MMERQERRQFTAGFGSSSWPSLSGAYLVCIILCYEAFDHARSRRGVQEGARGHQNVAHEATGGPLTTVWAVGLCDYQRKLGRSLYGERELGT